MATQRDREGPSRDPLMNMNAEDLLHLLREKLEELSTFTPGTHREARWTRWCSEMQAIVREVFGDESPELKGFSSATSWGRPIVGTEDYIAREADKRFAQICETSSGWLEALTLQIERFGVRRRTGSREFVGRPPRVFVAHGRPSKALDRLSDFLRALGCEPIVVEKMPSEGRSVNDNVEHYLNQSDCAIVLATGDDLVDGRVFARPNVHVEIGRFQERFRDKVVYLLEKNVALPSNVAEKVYERFTRDNLTSAFIKVANEVRAFGYLKASL
jgi:hypothetical protein